MPTVKESFEAMPGRFRADKASGTNATIQYDIGGDESYGGGLVTFDTAQLVRTSVSWNVSGNFGGGIYAGDPSNVDFVSSTVSHNIADAQGGGVYVGDLLTSKNSSFSPLIERIWLGRSAVRASSAQLETSMMPDARSPCPIK